ncbi:MAG TPA: hypothetical protein VJ946_06175 [Bacteroidales bacterium]|nr:hypothetical protein [Bacteroidales bacterium]
MLKRLTIALALLAGISLLFASCTSKVKSDIEDSWLLETMMAEDPYEEVWDFQSGGTLVKVRNGGESVDTAYYMIDRENTYVFVKITESEYTNGFYRVDKVNDDVLILTRYEFLDETVEGSYLRREFTRM